MPAVIGSSKPGFSEQESKMIAQKLKKLLKRLKKKQRDTEKLSEYKKKSKEEMKDAMIKERENLRNLLRAAEADQAPRGE